MKTRAGLGVRTRSGLARVLEAALEFRDPQADDQLMPLRTVLRASAASRPASLDVEMDRFENRVARDPQRLEQLRATEERILEMDCTGEGVRAHFERVTGHALADFDSQNPDRVETRQPQNVHSRKERLPLARMRAGSAVLASVLVICIFTLGSYGNDPLSDAIGQALASESVLFGSLGETTRGHPDPLLEQRRTQIRAALDRIDVARTSVLGFHTGYDPTALEEAAELLWKASNSASIVEPAPTELYNLRDEILRLVASSSGEDELNARDGTD